jgi:hypothetical protein
MSDFAPASFPQALPSPPHPAKSERRTKTDWGLFGVGAVSDAAFCGAGFYALVQDAGANLHAAGAFLAMRGVFNCLEMARPLVCHRAIAHPNATWRGACFGGVALLGGLTAVNIALPLNQSMRDLTAEPESTAIEVRNAEASLAGFDGEEAKLKAAVDAARAQYDKAQDAAKAAFANTRNLPRDHCWKHRCKADNVTETAGKAVDGANAAAAAALAALTNAETKLRDHSRENVIAALQAARGKHAKAARENWVYGGAATIMQADAAEIPGRDVSRALAIITGALSLLGGFAGAFMCLASVERLPASKVEAPAAEKTFQAPDTLLVDLNARINRAVDALEARQSKRETRASPSPATGTDERPAPVPAKAANTKPDEKPAANGGAAQPTGRPRGRPRTRHLTAAKTTNGDARSAPPSSSSE